VKFLAQQSSEVRKGKTTEDTKDTESGGKEVPDPDPNPFLLPSVSVSSVFSVVKDPEIARLLNRSVL
jgi:hypothetical protein